MFWSVTWMSLLDADDSTLCGASPTLYDGHQLSATSSRRVPPLSPGGSREHLHPCQLAAREGKVRAGRAMPGRPGPSLRPGDPLASTAMSYPPSTLGTSVRTKGGAEIGRAACRERGV